MMHAPVSNNASEMTNNVANNMPNNTIPNMNMLENTQGLKLIPGPKMYSRAHETTTLIVADSTIRNIHVGQLQDDVGDDQKDIIIRRFPGATADEMKFFIKDSLARFCPKNLVIFGGCNDVGWADKNRKNECDIAQSVLCMAEEGKKAGCQSIFVSSVLPRRGRQYERTIDRINAMLKECCCMQGYEYLDHGDVSLRHLCNDGIHPNSFGTAILRMNILSCFDGFNPYRTSFFGQYESAFSS